MAHSQLLESLAGVEANGHNLADGRPTLGDDHFVRRTRRWHNLDELNTTLEASLTQLKIGFNP